ncbi:solute carrier organic anion transporter family member 74D isoform X1 [Parasteatoda tepidariorum]|uniref:solute carrier organic anion transporter family member 74D isoform X1 n=1 Tax=Parasteatoda tepidariorum TaxID=114398 RepID=UPI00077F956A|nr:solute carrier organic anion transporter family member 74D isoform X1 [Parasteatoda tepidariorum]
MEHKFSPLPTSDSESSQPSVQESDQLCGLGRFKPQWLQKFADPKVYLVIFCLVGVLQGAYFTYFVGVLSTLEKRFAFESKISGVILIADNISATFISLVVGYYGGKGHKPRMIAMGMVIVLLSCFLSTIPYFIYGPALHFLSRDIVSVSNRKQEYCDTEFPDENCQSGLNSSSLTAISILFVANFMNGFGYTAYYTIGAPYLDDNVKKKNSPMYFSAMAALRIFGPTLGFLLSSFCLKFYEDPFYDPGIDSRNPRWVGAWWMGFFILGIALLFFTFLLALFPRELPARFRSEKKNVKKEDSKEADMPKLKDFPKSVKKLMKNPILVCHVISITFQVNGFAGYFVFMPKFMESQYHQSASDASLFSGATGIISMLLGILIGGFLIKKYKPRPKYLTGYMVLVEVFSVIGLLVSIFLGCSQIQMPGTTLNPDKSLSLYNECNAGCSCTRRVFEPVCGSDGVSTFFSPCFAGCPNTTGLNFPPVTAVPTTAMNTTIFHDCKCIASLNSTLSDFNSTYTSSFVTSGFCATGCTMFMVYIIVLCVSKFISSTARVGNTLITFRCVDAEDKSFALGAFGSILSLFAFIPYPLIYGALTDSACLVWEESCSQTGNCWLYDSDKFRYYLHGMSMLLISIGICFDIVVFFLSDRLKNFYGEEDEEEEKTSVDRLARWIKEEEEEDIIFTKCPRTDPNLEMDPII